MQQRLDYVLSLLGCTSPPDEPEKLVEYTEKIVAEKGEEYVRQNRQLLLAQWEYITSLGV